MNEGLKKINTAEAVVNYIKDQIRRAEVKPGDSLPSERALREQLGISRFSLREGLARLSALGIIHVRHGKRAIVTREINGTSLANVLMPFFVRNEFKVLEDLYAARLMLESETVRLAAVNRSDKDLAFIEQPLEIYDNIKIESLQNENRHINSSDELLLFGRSDFDFHHRIVRIAENGLFLKMFEAISRQAQEFLQNLASETRHCVIAHKGHREVFKHIKNRKPEEAVRAMRLHLKTCKEFYLMYLESSTESKSLKPNR